jgi:hypothetical protein
MDRMFNNDILQCPACKQDNEFEYSCVDWGINFEFPRRHCGVEFNVFVEWDPVFYTTLPKKERDKRSGADGAEPV